MAEHCPEPTQQLPDHAEVLRCVSLPAVPTVYGLDDPDDGVQSWVFVLPDGQALIVPSEGEATGLVHTDLNQVISWWTQLWGTELVLVTA